MIPWFDHDTQAEEAAVHGIHSSALGYGAA
jgi:hypothetical protein